VEEMTSRLPDTESPLGNRITAGVYSVGRMRGARREGVAGCCVMCLTVSIDLGLQGVGDYERAQEGKVTASSLPRNSRAVTGKVHLLRDKRLQAYLNKGA
jgi:hypothetical protein